MTTTWAMGTTHKWHQPSQCTHVKPQPPTPTHVNATYHSIANTALQLCKLAIQLFTQHRIHIKCEMINTMYRKPTPWKQYTVVHVFYIVC